MCENRSWNLEKEPVRYCKSDEKIFTRPFLMLGKVTFDEHVNALKRYCNCDNIAHIYITIYWLSFPKSKVIKGLNSRSDSHLKCRSADIKHVNVNASITGYCRGEMKICIFDIFSNKDISFMFL